MGRSVNYLSNAEVVIYFSDDAMSGFDADGNFNADEAQLNWDDFYYNLKEDIKSKLKSYVKCEKWDHNEVSIFLENDLCQIAISEYCGLYSLSVRAIEQDYYADDNRLNFAKHHAKQIEKSLVKILNNLGCTVLSKLGTFSNGETVFEKASV